MRRTFSRIVRQFATKPRHRLCGLVGAFILPHGALVLDPEFSKSQVGDSPAAVSDCRLLNEGLLEASAQIDALKPDLIVLLSPHCIRATEHHVIHVSQTLEGSAEWNGQWKDFKLKVESDKEGAKRLLREMAGHSGVNVVGISAATDVHSIHWGEVIPLYFVKHKCKVILMASRFSYNSEEAYNEECKELDKLRVVGEALAHWCDAEERRVIVVVSGDLSHGHLCAFDQQYPVCGEAVPYETAVMEWIGSLESKPLECATELMPEAMSCGHTAFAILDGILQTKSNCGAVIRSKLITPALHPSYYGMCVASFHFDQ